MSSRTVIIFVVSSRTAMYDDDVDDVTSFLALDVVEMNNHILIFVVVVVGARRS